MSKNKFYSRLMILIAFLAGTFVLVGCVRSMYKVGSPADKYYGQLERTGPHHVSPNINVIYPVYVIQQVPKHD